MKYIVVDTETDGPCPVMYSMLSLGAVCVDSKERAVGEKFYRTFKPISDVYQQEALDVNGFTREESLTFPVAEKSIAEFDEWLQKVSEGETIRMVVDNPCFDWQFVNYYMWQYVGMNRLGFSCYSLQSMYKGYRANMRASMHKLRDTKHTHNALDDAIGNAEALIKILNMFDHSKK